MIIDVHCHVGFSARRVDPFIPRFSFETNGAVASPGFDSYFSPRLLRRWAWRIVGRWLGVEPRLKPGDELDRQIEAVNEQHWSGATGVDRLVLLAFDEYHDDAGWPLGPSASRRQRGTDLFVSNSLVRILCRARPDRYFFGASIHPYRADATRMLEEVAAGGAVLVKWLPIHQNIRADDPRTVAFLRKAAELSLPLLIHYGGEMSLARQHMEFESPAPLLAVLRQLRADGAMPTVIVAHVATPSFIWQDSAGHRALVDALLGKFAEAPLYADISALGAFGRTPWLRRLAARRELHRKLVFGSDYPIPVMLSRWLCPLDRATRRRIAALPSWIEQAVQLQRAAGFDEGVFHRAGELLRVQ